MSATVKIKLDPSTRRAVKSTIKLLDRIAVRDSKAAAGIKPATIVFPEDDSDLQAARTAVIDRLVDIV